MEPSIHVVKPFCKMHLLETLFKTRYNFRSPEVITVDNVIDQRIYSDLQLVDPTFS